MDIAFRTRKLERAFNSVTALQKTYGAQMTKIIMMRMAVLKAARNLALVPTTRPRGGTSSVAIETGSSRSISFTPTDSFSNPITGRFRAKTMAGSTRNR